MNHRIIANLSAIEREFRTRTILVVACFTRSKQSFKYTGGKEID
jgi:hypothetical protein